MFWAGLILGTVIGASAVAYWPSAGAQIKSVESDAVAKAAAKVKL